MPVTAGGELLTQLRDDETFRMMVAQAATHDEKLEVLVARGFDRSSMESVKMPVGPRYSELTDEEMELVAAGSTWDWVSAVTVVAAVAAL